MNAFEYCRAVTLVEALQLHKENPNVTLLAGGTDLLVKLNEQIMKPKVVLDLSLIKEMHGIQLKDGQITLGALTTHTEIVNSEILQKFAPALVQASSMVGSLQIRNRGTIGGNICNASPAADAVPALIALGAEIRLMKAKQERIVPLEDFFLGSGKTILAPGEILTQVLLKAQGPNQGSAFRKLGKRKALAISVVNAGVFMEIDAESQIIRKVRIALGSVAPTPMRAKQAEKLMLGQRMTKELLKEIELSVAAEVRPIDDIRSQAEYRRRVAGELGQRAAEEAWNNAAFLG